MVDKCKTWINIIEIDNGWVVINKTADTANFFKDLSAVAEYIKSLDEPRL